MSQNSSAHRYPIYIPSKGRAQSQMTAKCFASEGVPFSVVVEPQEADAYADVVGRDRVLVLPFSNLGSVIPARNWIKQHATENGHARHWQFDDNIQFFARRYKGQRVKCDATPALKAVEDFTDRYTNIAISGFNYFMFIIPQNKIPPFHLNCRVYSASLINNEIPHQWRGRYNEDTDICLQVLADGWCTVLFNAFMVLKTTTMVLKGGNTDALYRGDGRAKMARALERLWPGVVTTKRRFHRPQHVVAGQWLKFDNQLIRRPDLDWDAIEGGGNNEFGLTLGAVAGRTAKNNSAKEYLEAYHAKRSPRPAETAPEE